MTLYALKKLWELRWYGGLFAAIQTTPIGVAIATPSGGVTCSMTRAGGGCLAEHGTVGPIEGGVARTGPT